MVGFSPQRGITRPYTAETVIQLRDVFPESFSGNQQALKLRDILDKHHKANTASYTFSPTDNVTLQRMIEAGFGGYLQRLKSARG